MVSYGSLWFLTVPFRFLNFLLDPFIIILLTFVLHKLCIYLNIIIADEKNFIYVIVVSMYFFLNSVETCPRCHAQKPTNRYVYYSCTPITTSIQTPFTGSKSKSTFTSLYLYSLYLLTSPTSGRIQIYNDKFTMDLRWFTHSRVCYSSQEPEVYQKRKR